MQARVYNTLDARDCSVHVFVYLPGQVHKEVWQNHMMDRSNLIGGLLMALSSTWTTDGHSMEEMETPRCVHNMPIFIMSTYTPNAPHTTKRCKGIISTKLIQKSMIAMYTTLVASTLCLS